MAEEKVKDFLECADSGQTPNGEAIRDSELTTKPANLVLNFIKNHPAIIGTLLYLQAAAVGITYNYSLFSEFGINVFDLAEANDFLFGAIKEPFAYIAVFISVLGASIMVIILQKFGPLRGKSRILFIRISSILIISLFIVYTFYAPWFYGRVKARSIVDSKSKLVKLCLKGKPEELNGLIPKGNISIIGTTEKFSIFYAHESKRSFVIHIANIALILFATEPKITDKLKPAP